MFTDHKISAFQQRVSDLPDTPTLSASELKARFDACPEELRAALNAVCDDGKALEDRMDAYRAQTFTGEIERDMLSTDVQEELSAKAEQEALDAEAAARAAGDAALQTQLAAKCEVVLGTYTGDGTTERVISLGFTPKAVLVQAAAIRGEYYYWGLALPGVPCGSSPYISLKIVTNGFQVREYSYEERMNAQNHKYNYIAFK